MQRPRERTPQRRTVTWSNIGSKSSHVYCGGKILNIATATYKSYADSTYEHGDIGAVCDHLDNIALNILCVEEFMSSAAVGAALAATAETAATRGSQVVTAAAGLEEVWCEVSGAAV
jgi:hypothetical protein